MLKQKNLQYNKIKLLKNKNFNSLVIHLSNLTQFETFSLFLLLKENNIFVFNIKLNILKKYFNRSDLFNGPTYLLGFKNFDNVFNVINNKVFKNKIIPLTFIIQANF